MRMKRLAAACTCLLVVSALVCTGCAGKGMQTRADGGPGRLDFREVVKEATDKVYPAVVFIKCVKETHASGKKSSQEVAGSGVIISPDGELLTNWHVVDKAVEVRCLLYDGRAFDAEVLGTDKDTDLALLKLKLPPGAGPVPCAAMGDSAQLQEGDFVMAMGAPWGLSRSVSIGIISCNRRFLEGRSEYNLWLQTDAAICPGNSGGPLVNTAGEVVGVNALAALIGGDIGFAIPSEIILHLVPQLREHGRVNWSWTGLQLQPLRDFNRNIYFEGAEGVIVSETDKESPARRAGIQARDRILKANGQKLDAVTEEDLPAVRRTLGMLPKYEAVGVELVRDGARVVVEMTPCEKGDVEGEELDCPRWDLAVKSINQFDNLEIYFYRKKGVFIYSVKYPGNAATANLMPKDIILKIDGNEVTALDDVKAIHEASLENVATKRRIVFSVLRNGLLQQKVLDISRDYSRE